MSQPSSDSEIATKSNLPSLSPNGDGKNKKSKRPDQQLYIPPPVKCTSKGNEIDGQTHLKNDKNKEQTAPSWDSLYDDNGEAIDNEIVEELNSELAIKVVTKQLANSKLDYSKFSDSNELDEAGTDCGNILEVFDFSSDLKTRDLVVSLSVSHFKHFDIDWVDDTHALVIFSSSSQASEALNTTYANLKLRPLSEAIKESQLKAKKRLENKAPRRPRPETTTFLARRLVAGALGIKADMNPEQRRAEKEKLRLAKEKKQQLQKQMQKSAWDEEPS